MDSQLAKAAIELIGRADIKGAEAAVTAKVQQSLMLIERNLSVVLDSAAHTELTGAKRNLDKVKEILTCDGTDAQKLDSIYEALKIERVKKAGAK